MMVPLPMFAVIKAQAGLLLLIDLPVVPTPPHPPPPRRVQLGRTALRPPSERSALAKKKLKF